jgi:hypothetical protein
LVAAAVVAAKVAGEGRDVSVRESILGIDYIVLYSFEVVVCSVEFWEYFINKANYYYHALTLKKYARNLYSHDFWHSFSCPPTLFHSFTLFFTSKAMDGMGNSVLSWCTFWQFLGILAYKRGWLIGTLQSHTLEVCKRSLN